MVFQAHLPSKNLQPFVQCYLEVDSRLNVTSGEHTLFPNGCSGIFFNFGNTGKIIINQAYKTPPVSIFGQIDRHFIATHKPGFYSLGVLFKPTALSRILEVDMSEFTNKTFEGNLIRNDFKSLHSQLEEKLLVNDKVNLLNKYFTKTTRDLSSDYTLSAAAVQIIQEKTGVSIKKITSQLNVSERHLETLFKKAVGLSPKTYSMIIRFNRIEKLLNEKSVVNWERLDFTHEYYDQNHFIKDFKRFTGNTPSDYLLNNFEMGRSYLLR